MKKTSLILFLLLFTGLYRAAAETGNPAPCATAGPANPQVRSVQDPDSLVVALLPVINEDSIQHYIQHLQGFGTRFCLSPNHKDVALWIEEKLQSFGYINVRLDSFQIVSEWPYGTGDLYTTWQYNVIADLTGSVTPDIHFITGGHYDDVVFPGDAFGVCPGADDNASGTAAALEIARVMKTSGFEPDATIRFVLFAAEELGLHGSSHYVNEALQSGETIPMMVNMDMIGHEPLDSAWALHLHAYEGSGWLAGLAGEIAGDHTPLSIRVTMNSSSVGSDSDPFFNAGLPAIFLQEDIFSPEYHSLNDVDTNINFPYCTAITRVACGMLVHQANRPLRVNFSLFNPGDGVSLIPHWPGNSAQNIAGYRVYIGTVSGVYDTSYFTPDTLYHLTGLATGTEYFVAVTAVNESGFESIPVELSDIPAIVTMDQGILIVDDSEGGYYTPPDSVIDQYYRGICHGFQTSEYETALEGPVDLTDLGPYSSVIWHINKPSPASTLQQSLTEIRQYQELGGNVLFTLFQPNRNFTGNTAFPSVCRAGSYLYDMAGIEHLDYTNYSAFIRAIPTTTNYPLLAVDTSKTLPVLNHHLQYTDALYAIDPSNVIYTFDSDYDSLTTQGSMIGDPVGVTYYGDVFKTVTLSFPLFYMDSAAAQSFLHFVLEIVFEETYTGLPSGEKGTRDILISPNPSSGEFHVEPGPGIKPPTGFSVFDISGRKVEEVTYQSNTMDLSHLERGLYFLRPEGSNTRVPVKVMIIR